ncbi:hypothetical protein K438DRAFT_1981234 [Mycena galopus ATCC 62051]|nr:hypothetical protein K438DRAFT_1981234 [Mycena galopus ATCC 62051]
MSSEVERKGSDENVVEVPAAAKAPSGSDSDDSRRTFPDGAILRVDTQHARSSTTPNTGAACICLSDLLGPKSDLAFAILSTFILNAPWLYDFFEKETPVVLVTDANMCGAGGEAQTLTLKKIFPSWIRVCPPLPSVGYGSMHMKLMLLFGKQGGLRLVVGSANLVSHEWQDVENYVFVQDLPPSSHSSGSSPTTQAANEKPGESFPAMLTRALRALGVEEALGIMARQGHTALPLPTLLHHGTAPTQLETRWDWSRVRAALVPSLSGRWQGWTGEGGVLWSAQPRLMRAVQALGCSLEDLNASVQSGSGGGGGKGGGGRWEAVARELRKMKEDEKEGGKVELELDCLTSSTGSYTAPWLTAFRLCASGNTKGLQESLGWARTKTPPQGPTRILFPTLETVQGMVLGEAGAGSVSMASCFMASFDLDGMRVLLAPFLTRTRTRISLPANLLPLAPVLALSSRCPHPAPAPRAPPTPFPSPSMPSLLHSLALLPLSPTLSPASPCLAILLDPLFDPLPSSLRPFVSSSHLVPIPHHLPSPITFLPPLPLPLISALLRDSKTGLEMRDARSRSGEGRVGMHTKMILGTLRAPPMEGTDPDATESDADSGEVEIVADGNEKGKGKDAGRGKGKKRPHAWLYVGSHNFTPSAWGWMSGSGFSPVVTVANYELGVVLRLETAEDAAAAVAWEVPARPYGKGDVPWILEESSFFQ